MSASSADAGALDEAESLTGESGQPGAGSNSAAQSVTADTEPVEGHAEPVAGEAEPVGGETVGGTGPVEGETAGGAGPDVAAVVAERDAYLEDLRRVTAEFTNFRRQTMKRNTEMVAQAASRLARELLVVLDACEAAVSQGVEGIEALQAQLLGVLSAEGLTVLGTVDEPFDPGFHEAVMSEESSEDDQDAPVVSEVLRTGYAWNGRVLRPAMVKVRG